MALKATKLTLNAKSVAVSRKEKVSDLSPEALQHLESQRDDKQPVKETREEGGKPMVYWNPSQRSVSRGNGQLL